MAFIIPAGTQVVLKGPRRVPRAGITKPAGSVAEAIRSPSSNRRSYLLRFSAGTELQARFGELAVRRRQIDEELGRPVESLETPGDRLRRYVIYRAAVGSRA